MKTKYFSMMAAVMLLATGCGTTSDDSEKTVLKQGRFFDGNISGIEYECASGIKGVTDASGNYACPEKDEAVSFRLGGITATVPAENEITPQMLSDGNESRMLMIVREVLGADRDHNASNGIEVDPDAFGNALADEEDAVRFLQTHFGYTPSQSSSSADETYSSVGDVSSSNGTSESSEMSSSVSETSSSVSETSSAFPESSSVQSDSSSSFVSPFPETGNTWSHSAVASAGASSSVPVMSSSVSSQASSSSSEEEKEPVSSLSSSSEASSTASSSSSGSSGSQPSKAAVIESEAKEWYVRLVAEAPARGLKTQGAQLGELEAADAVEKHTLKALEPFGGSYLDIVFVDPDGVAKGEYSVNFHVHNDHMPDSWRFTVKTDDSRSDIIVTWRGLYVLSPYVDAQGRTRYREYRSLTNPLLKKMQVVDEKTGKTLPAAVNGQAPAFIINMDGEKTRTFRWELLTSNANATVPSVSPVRIQKAASRFLREASEPKPVEFDLGKPPMFK